MQFAINILVEQKINNVNAKKENATTLLVTTVIKNMKRIYRRGYI